ncbi:FAD-dependent monooxygenase [endosymbiont of unidentified scaly snail isolate Monju]|uniref:FAD-dependent monooxygenase n=1 Tax=endosymbiont of unidentified scaly snail isolate Monju TaxID=1248727 RepID=UPI0003892128|nr:FAD-dependent monooxygenase [endosymbiont of unidentified scaly snail isolate Monju]BAN70175.1 2-octaprenyl-3-methyl-6-methoxy-1,4-benzoquinol hydroxylase [endosymbiont of unidentified scaly snail isolate Monju]
MSDTPAHDLLGALRVAEGVDWIAPAQVVAVRADVDRACITVEQDGKRTELEAALLVAADGGRSFVREALGLPVVKRDYGQSAVVTNVTPERPHRNVAFERFTEEGPIALLPMTGGRCAVVWTVPDERVESVLALDDAAFLAAFQERFGHRLGRFLRVGRRDAYPLKLLRVREAVRGRVALVGNAVLAGYEAWRLDEQRKMGQATDGLARLFANPLPPLRLARNLGMLALDLFAPARHALARTAMGLHGRLPRLALLERTEPALDWPADSYDLRVSALTRASETMLRNLGAWAGMRVCAYERMRVWDARGFGEIAFDAADIGEPNLGHIVENREIVAALWRAIRQRPEIEVVTGQEIAALEEDGPALRLGDGRVLRAQLRELAGIGLSARDYDQYAVVATVRPEAGNRATAWQRFLPEGPLVLLPLRDDLFSIVWSITPAEAAALVEATPEDFAQRLTLASERCCGELALVDPQRAAFPLRLQRATTYVRPGIALVGDAAHVIHPLAAGQGVNLGLLDAGALLDVLGDARSRGEPLGALGVLRRYERARRGHNLAVQMTMDAFKHLFSNRNPALYLARNLGLGLADRIPPLRRQFERIALGQGIELPSLARDESDTCR